MSFDSLEKEQYKKLPYNMIIHKYYRVQNHKDLSLNPESDMLF
jgi:hypothetical protein